VSHLHQDPTAEGVAEITKKTPAKTRDFLYGGYLSLAIAAAMLAWHRAPNVLAPMVVLGLMTAVCVYLLGREVTRNTHAPGRTLLWAVIIFVVCLLSLFVSTEFFGVPQNGQVTFARLLRNPSLLSLGSDGVPVEIPAGEFRRPDKAFTENLEVKGVDDQYSRSHTLKQRSPLVVEGVLVATDGPGTHRTIFTPSLDLERGIIVTNGGSLTIETNTVISNGGAIHAFLDDPKPTESGKGQNGGQVKIIVYDRIEGDLLVDLAGGTGAQGHRGLDGANGRNGAEGEHSAQSLVGCMHGGGRGGDGEGGHAAGSGQQGLAGGDGGLLILAGTSPEALAKSITLDSKVARGGAGGLPGAPGSGGKGGPGGGGGGYCGGGPGGTEGPPGAPGLQGLEGPAGTHSRMQLRSLPF